MTGKKLLSYRTELSDLSAASPWFKRRPTVLFVMLHFVVSNAGKNAVIKRQTASLSCVTTRLATYLLLLLLKVGAELCTLIDQIKLTLALITVNAFPQKPVSLMDKRSDCEGTAKAIRSHECTEVLCMSLHK